MNDCIHASHCRLDRHLIIDIANQNFHALREYAQCRSIDRKGTDLTAFLVRRMDDTTGYNNLSASSLYRENFLSADISCASWLSAVAMMILSCGSL